MPSYNSNRRERETLLHYLAVMQPNLVVPVNYYMISLICTHHLLGNTKLQFLRSDYWLVSFESLLC